MVQLVNRLICVQEDSCLLIIVGNKANGQIPKRVFQENKAHQVFRKTNISYSVCARKFDVLCFLETPVLRFSLLPYYRLKLWKILLKGFIWSVSLTE